MRVLKRWRVQVLRVQARTVQGWCEPVSTGDVPELMSGMTADGKSDPCSSMKMVASPAPLQIDGR
jgi:hypothetical protein